MSEPELVVASLSAGRSPFNRSGRDPAVSARGGILVPHYCCITDQTVPWYIVSGQGERVFLHFLYLSAV